MPKGKQQRPYAWLTLIIYMIPVVVLVTGAVAWPTSTRVAGAAQANSPVQIIPGGQNLDFNAPLGTLKEGDTVYVAVGPNGADAEDTFGINYSLFLMP